MVLFLDVVIFGGLLLLIDCCRCVRVFRVLVLVILIFCGFICMFGWICCRLFMMIWLFLFRLLWMMCRFFSFGFILMVW